MSSLPTGTVTFLFTDIEGSTKLAQVYPELWETLRDRHHAILQSAIEAHNGYVFQVIGDAFCAAFHTARDGLKAALQAQRKLQTEAWGKTPIKVRMGLHTGVAELNESGYRGYLTMARVQRVMSTAYGGQILLSNASAELIRGELPEGVTLRDMQENRLKGLLNPEHLWQAVVADLPQDFPPLQTLNSIPNNLPIQVTSFVGREKEIGEVKQLLSTARLLTLTGSGGTGKTRLSLHVAAEVLDTFKNGVWFIELAPLSDPALVPFSIASALGLREEPGRPLITTLMDWLRDKELLLILDNCEHLIEACAKFADEVLHASHATRILTTSREALGIAGESIYHVPSLQTPNPEEKIKIEQFEQYAAVRLFIDRATQSLSTFRVTNANAPAVAQICYRLDGIPLAIELAAARVKALSVEKIAERLDDRFRLLTGGSRTALPRQRTLQATIDWSYNLLSEDERVLLRKLSVFAGGWTLEAAEQVCASDIIASDQILDLLLHLVDKSLVVADTNASEPRYHMLETVRQYAQEKLIESEEGEGLRDQHLAYFLDLAEQADKEMHGPNQIEWLEHLEKDHDNHRAALDWCLSNQKTEAALRLLGALAWPWSMRDHFSEVESWLNKIRVLPDVSDYAGLYARLLNHIGDNRCEGGEFREARSILEESRAIWLKLGVEGERGLAEALNYLGIVARSYEGDITTAQSFFEQSFELYQKHGDEWGMSWIIFQLGSNAYIQGHYAEAEEQFMKSLTKFQELGDKFAVAYMCSGMGDLAQFLGDYERAGKFYEQNLEIFQQLHSRFVLAWPFLNLGWVALYGGDYRKAKSLFDESLKRSVEDSNKALVTACLMGLASVLGMTSKSEQAARLFGAVQSLVESTRRTGHMELSAQKEFDHYVAVVRGQLDEVAFAKALAEGRTMTLEQAIAFALEETDA